MQLLFKMYNNSFINTSIARVILHVPSWYTTLYAPFLIRQIAATLAGGNLLVVGGIFIPIFPIGFEIALNAFSIGGHCYGHRLD